MRGHEFSDADLARLAAGARILEREQIEARRPQSPISDLKMVIGGWTISVHDARLVLPPNLSLSMPDDRVIALAVDMPDPSNRLLLLTGESFIPAFIADLQKPIRTPEEIAAAANGSPSEAAPDS